jgi:hypothetical protein
MNPSFAIFPPQWSADFSDHLADYRAALMVYCDDKPNPAAAFAAALNRSE